MSRLVQTPGVATFRLAAGLGLGLLLGTAPAAIAGDAAAEPADSHFTFSFLPKAFQKDPPVHMTVITEMTLAGSKARVPTAAKPMYYLAHSVGYHDEGDGYTEKRILPVATLEAQLQQALAQNHYLPADAAHPASLVMFFSWGAANKIDNRTDSLVETSPTLGPGQIDTGTANYYEEPTDVMSYDFATRQNFLARAQLVGGIRFAHEVAQALGQADIMHNTSVTIPGLDPLQLLEQREPLVRDLIDETRDDCYYVVASAYDAYALLHEKQRRLLWQTKMTTNSAGIAMAQTLPALIQSGAPYFGRAMAQATILHGHLEPEGHVEVGTPTVMPDLPAPAATAAK